MVKDGRRQLSLLDEFILPSLNQTEYSLRQSGTGTEITSLTPNALKSISSKDTQGLFPMTIFWPYQVLYTLRRDMTDGKKCRIITQTLPQNIFEIEWTITQRVIQRSKQNLRLFRIFLILQLQFSSNSFLSKS